MAVKINAGEVKRGDVFFIDPFQVIQEESNRGRHRAPEPDSIRKLAVNLLEIGQLQPVEARRIEDNKLQLTLGFTRTAAARLIREGFEYDGESYHDPDFKLKVSVVDCNEQMAFIRNVVENAHRDQTSPIDDAFNQQRLRDQYGMSDVEIARIYGYCSNGETSSSKVCRLRKLLRLNSEQQDLVHSGKLSVQAALDLLDLPEDKRDEVVESVQPKENGKISGSTVREAVRAKLLDDDAQDAAETAPVVTKSKPRTISEIRRFLNEIIQDDDMEADVVTFCEAMLAWVNGTRTNESMLYVIQQLTAVLA